MLQKIKYIWSLLFSAGMTTMKITSLVLVIFMIWGYYGENFSEKSPDFFVKLDQKQICGVVFGAAVWRDDKPSHALYDRTMTGIDLYKLEKINCLIFSGGASKFGAHEVDVMLKMALEEKIPRKNIYLDYNGINTGATVKNLSLLKKQEKFYSGYLGKDIAFVMISNDFHIPRINFFMWKHLGIYQEFYSERAYYFQGRYYKELQFFLREMVALVYYGWSEIFLVFCFFLAKLIYRGKKNRIFLKKGFWKKIRKKLRRK